MTAWSELKERGPVEPLAGRGRPMFEVAPVVLAQPPDLVATGFLRLCVRGELQHADRPLTAFEISRQVLRHHPNRWAAKSIEKKVYVLERKGELVVVGEGLSPDRSPCFLYVLAEAS